MFRGLEGLMTDMLEWGERGFQKVTDRMVKPTAGFITECLPILIFMAIVYVVSSWLFPTMPFLWGTLALLCGGLAVADRLRDLGG